ncbi:hypothetical protein FACS18949_03730 [Clostridia bacterium]|nr:hypothetical protein FACS18949_03730 [Clostridia bacterium]
MLKKLSYIGNKALEILSGVFLPIVNVICAAGILKGVTALLAAVGVLDGDSYAAKILGIMGDSLFYFLPVLLAVSAARSFGLNMFSAALIGCMLLSPDLTPNFSNSVIPILLAIALLYFTERLCEKLLPEAVRAMFTAVISVIAVGAAALLLLGPLGRALGGYIASGYNAVYELSAPAAAALVGFFIQPMVSMGLQWSIIPISINNVAVSGHDTLISFFGPASFAQIGAAFAVFLKAKSKQLKSTAFSAWIITLFGVTEPMLFGVALRLKKPLLAVCIAGAVGGVIVGFSGVTAITFAFPSFLTLPIFLGQGFGMFMAGNAVGLALGFVLTLALGFDEDALS